MNEQLKQYLDQMSRFQRNYAEGVNLGLRAPTGTQSILEAAFKLNPFKGGNTEGFNEGITDAEQALQYQNMGQMPSLLSLPANEGMPNYAEGTAPLMLGGGLLMDERQMLINIAEDMSAPRNMRLNAIERLRALGDNECLVQNPTTHLYGLV